MEIGFYCVCLNESKQQSYFMQKSDVILAITKFFSHPIFLSGVTSWFLSQAIKTLSAILSKSIKDSKDILSLLFWRTGGMPSSHSALVFSLVACLGVNNGINSDIFLFALAVAVITARDALGVRRASGIQAKILNNLGTKFAEQNPEFKFKQIKEIQGHTPSQVVAGSILGTVIGLFFSSFFPSPL